EGTYVITRTWSLVDDCGNKADDQVQTITVSDNIAPEFVEALPADSTVECDNVPDADTLTATDNCSDATVTYNEVRTDGSCDGNYTLARTWTATDACGNETSHTQTITVQDTTAPTFVEALPADATVECDNVPDADTLTATDNCGDATVTYNEVRTDGDCPSNYTLARTWTATDECGNEISHTQTITVQDTTAPTFTVPADIEIFTDADCNYDASVSVTGDVTDEADNCSTGLDATYVDDVADGSCEGTYVITRTWTLTDECGNETSHDQTITVSDNIKPTFTAPADIEIFTDADCNYDASVSVTGDVTDENDNCSTGLEATFSDSIADGACEGTYIITRTWSLVDNCGNAADDQVQTITVSDNIAPEFVEALPADATVECDEVPDAATLTATDNCSDATVTFSEERADGDCPSNYTLTRTWTATDECGNETAHSQVITVQDTTAPAFVEELPADATVECDEVPDAATLTATDNCGDATVTFSEERA
ncbi:gliding motility-associated C-terminal domain-containing protein, partial [Flavobacteriaceae sp. LMIT009]